MTTSVVLFSAVVMCFLIFFFFFFSSRRRHTRLQGDWSSDVCSSDLEQVGAEHDVQPFLRYQARAHPEERRMGALRQTVGLLQRGLAAPLAGEIVDRVVRDRKSTRLNSSHLVISYAVFCLKKKNKHTLAEMHHRFGRVTRLELLYYDFGDVPGL